MHGIAIAKNRADRARSKAGLWQRVKAGILANSFFIGFVILPTLIVAVYYLCFASDQYESSADYVVRRAENSVGSEGMGQILGFSLGSSASSSEAYVVQQYLLSHDAVDRLRKEDNLVGMFRRPGTDWISRLWFANPKPETLLKYYRKQVTLQQDETSGITHLQVHTFRPEDSREIAAKLLQMGEEQINQINQRTYIDQVANAQRELDEANRQLADVQVKMTSYRRGTQDIDPTDSGRAQVSMVTGLTANLVAARAKLQAMAGVVSPVSPQYQAMAKQVHALETQVNSQAAEMAGPGHSIANRLGDFEQLVVKRDQIAKVYAAAAVQLEQAKAEAKRKQLYLIKVVAPNMPVKSEYPKRGIIILEVFASLFFAYAIGWLLWAGVKEHAL
ncbi:MAG: lipopolysaccharide biosynthesis protein [Sphingomonadales bacterium]|nr:lipopolysaccharide biosynthesis protein [Sphingomonadales bacterium]MDE2171530.1 lipopolysaccharide biosynthesis protein [Sphingomonadales bacterium]